MMNNYYSNELYHWGIKGMKWGVRRYQNKDGSLTAAGQKRYAETWRDNFRETSYKEKPSTVFDKKGLSGKSFDDIHKRMSKTADEIRQCGKEAQQLFKGMDDDEHSRCASIAGIANSLDYNFFKGTMEDVANTAWFYIYEDGDQGLVNSRSVYVREKGLLDQATKLYSKEQELKKRYTDECQQMVNEVLGQYGNTPISAYSSSTVSSNIASRMLGYEDDKIDKDTDYSLYALAESCEWGHGDTINKTVEKATKIVDKIDYRRDNIDYMYDAVKNLNLSDVHMDNMTDAQWTMLNEEMRRLNKNGRPTTRTMLDYDD